MSDAISFQPLAGGGQTLSTSVWLGAPRGEVFAFFADAFELETITPRWLHFRVLAERPLTIRAGTHIDYRLRLHGLPVRWQSEISLWEPPFRFVDRQLRGPYRLWRHEHTFVEERGGTRVNDRVDYRVPGGPLVERLLVRRDLRQIFEFRRQRMAEIFRARGFATSG